MTQPLIIKASTDIQKMWKDSLKLFKQHLTSSLPKKLRVALEINPISKMSRLAISERARIIDSSKAREDNFVVITFEPSREDANKGRLMKVWLCKPGGSVTRWVDPKYLTTDRFCRMVIEFITDGDVTAIETFPEATKSKD